LAQPVSPSHKPQPRSRYNLALGVFSDPPELSDLFDSDDINTLKKLSHPANRPGYGSRTSCPNLEEYPMLPPTNSQIILLTSEFIHHSFGARSLHKAAGPAFLIGSEQSWESNHMSEKKRVVAASPPIKQTAKLYMGTHTVSQSSLLSESTPAKVRAHLSHGKGDEPRPNSTSAPVATVRFGFRMKQHCDGTSHEGLRESCEQPKHSRPGGSK